MKPYEFLLEVNRSISRKIGWKPISLGALLGFSLSVLKSVSMIPENKHEAARMLYDLSQQKMLLHSYKPVALDEAYALLEKDNNYLFWLLVSKNSPIRITMTLTFVIFASLVYKYGWQSGQQQLSGSAADIIPSDKLAAEMKDLCERMAKADNQLKIKIAGLERRIINYEAAEVLANQIVQLYQLAEQHHFNVNDFLCPITHSIMRYPVITADGRHYEYSAVKQWYDLGHRACIINKLVELRDPAELYVDTDTQRKIIAFLQQLLKK
ncbi:MAG: hypothetical protein K2Q14_02895 [Gammaproteobacteria bacterium]|nr:hypothetical protein [Gammaproteobacteria bacterium]